MLIYFLGFIAAFTGIVVFMVWYARLMFRKIYGDIREEIEYIVTNGVSPPGWEERLEKRLAKCGDEKGRAAAKARHAKYVNRRIMDYTHFMKSTSLIGSEAERETSLERLESLRREYADGGRHD